jgi:L-threonylcarbamoyladenylate synthase
MTVVASTPANIRRAAELLRQGRLVAFPTETVYGVGADAFSEAAVERLFRAKGRPHFDPLIVHVAELAALADVCRLDERARRLAEAFWPGPLTMVLPKLDSVPDIVTSGLPTVAVRLPSHPVARALLEEAGLPIAAPSANPFGRLSPTMAEHVARGLGDSVDLILDGGSCQVGVESTIVDLSVEPVALLRAGATEIAEIEAVVGEVAMPLRPATPRAPGQLESHYAPRTNLVLLDGRASKPPAGVRIGLLSFTGSGPAPDGFAAVEVLSPSGNIREAAKNLFSALHRLDRLELDAIYAEPVPASGLGVAILDRLKKAAVRR